MSDSDVMWIVMTLTISGGRADGRPWPDRLGAAIDVPREEGEHLVKVGQAFEVAPPAGVQATLIPAPAADPVSEPAATAAGPVPETAAGAQAAAASAGVPAAEVPEPAAEEIPAEAPADSPELPKPADSKQAWIDYALGQGASAAAVADATKADLMSRFGGRL